MKTVIASFSTMKSWADDFWHNRTIYKRINSFA
jgi:hypothetical protein